MSLIDNIMNISSLDRKIITYIVDKLDQDINYNIQIIHDPEKMGQYMILRDIDTADNYFLDYGVLLYGQASFGLNSIFENRKWNKREVEFKVPRFNIDTPFAIRINVEFLPNVENRTDVSDSDYIIIYEPTGENSFLSIENIEYFLTEQSWCYSDFFIAAKRAELLKNLNTIPVPLDQSYLIDVVKNIDPLQDYQITVVHDATEMKKKLTLDKYYTKTDGDRYYCAIQKGITISEAAIFGEDLLVEIFSQGKLIRTKKEYTEPVLDSSNVIYAIIKETSTINPFNDKIYLVFYSPEDKSN